jgi:hypothetical protein
MLNLTVFTFIVSKLLYMPQDKQISVYNLCPTTSTFLVKSSVTDTCAAVIVGIARPLCIPN